MSTKLVLLADAVVAAASAQGNLDPELDELTETAAQMEASLEGISENELPIEVPIVFAQ